MRNRRFDEAKRVNEPKNQGRHHRTQRTKRALPRPSLRTCSAIGQANAPSPMEGGRGPGGDIFIELIIPHLRYIEFVCIFAFKTDTDKFCRLLGSTKGIVVSEVNPEIVDYNIIEIMVNYQKPIVLAESTTQKADCRPNSKPCGRPCNPPKPRGSN